MRCFFHFLFILATLLPILFLSGCQDETYFGDEIPVIRANEVTSIGPTGVVLEGEVLYTPEKQVIDFGFVWGDTESLNAKAAYRNKLSLGSEAAPKRYSTKLDRDLLPDQDYFYRFYVETEDGLTQSNAIGFKSQGSAWNPWEQSGLEFPPFFDFNRFSQVFWENKVYLIGRRDRIPVFDPISREWESIQVNFNDSYPDPLFISDGKAYYSFWYSLINERIKAVDLRTGEILQSFPIFDTLAQYLETYFWFCHGPYCYTYLRAQSSFTYFLWKFDRNTLQGRALHSPPDFNTDNSRVLYWNDKILVWSGQQLWEYIPDDSWQGSGEWVLLSQYPGTSSDIGPSAVFISGDKLIAGWPQKSIYHGFINELWEYSLTKRQWGRSHLAPGLPESFSRYQIQVPEGYYLVLSPPPPPGNGIWFFNHEKFFPLE